MTDSDSSYPPHRAFVGPAEQYELMGATQFMLAVTIGLKPQHRLLDVGCGSLRAGRFLMSYLQPGHYFGIEPNGWLVDDAFEHELGQDFRSMRRPRFDQNTRFDGGVFGVPFDMVLAQSVFSHTGSDLLLDGLRALSGCLAPGGLMLSTFKVDVFDEGFQGWKYPGGVRYTENTLNRLITQSGLHFRRIPWYHPRQTWYVLANDPAVIPTADSFDRYLSGAVLACPEWEDAPHRPPWLAD